MDTFSASIVESFQHGLLQHLLCKVFSSIVCLNGLFILEIAIMYLQVHATSSIRPASAPVIIKNPIAFVVEVYDTVMYYL